MWKCLGRATPVEIKEAFQTSKYCDLLALEIIQHILRTVEVVSNTATGGLLDLRQAQDVLPLRGLSPKQRLLAQFDDLQNH